LLAVIQKMKITNEKYKNLNLANVDERGENFIIDFAYSSILGLIIVMLTFQNFIFAILIYVIARFLYYFGFEFFGGRTPGKYQTKTKVVNRKGEKPSTIQLIKRNLTRFISFFSAISDDERALHDNLSNTFVIKNTGLKKIELKQPLILLFFLAMSGYWIYVIATKPKLNTIDIVIVLALVLSSIYALISGIKKIKTTANNTYK